MRTFLRFLLFFALGVGALGGLLRLFALRVIRIPSDDPYLEASVAPTLRGGDLIVLYRLSPPGFGDLVVCPEPGAEDRLVIGRIVGEPGDAVEIRGSTVRVNGEASSSEGKCIEPTFTVADPASGAETELRCDREDLLGRVHLRGRGTKQDGRPDVSLTAGPGELVLVSDNRWFPYDSRDFGPVESASCRETVLFRLLGAGGFRDARTRFTYIR